MHPDHFQPDQPDRPWDRHIHALAATQTLAAAEAYAQGLRSASCYGESIAKADDR